MKFTDLPLNVPVTADIPRHSHGGETWPYVFIRLSNTTVAVGLPDDSFLVELPANGWAWEGYQILDTPTELDAIECGQVPEIALRALLDNEPSLFNIDAAAYMHWVNTAELKHKCTCDLRGANAWAGCRCGGI